MPRIAAALGVFATLTFCVGFNVVQYPAVWKMVAPSPSPAQPKKAAEPTTSTPPTAAAKTVPIAVPKRDAKATPDLMSKPAPAVPAMSASMPPVGKPVCDATTGVCRLPSAPIAEPSSKGAVAKAERATPIGSPKASPPAKKKDDAKKSKPAQPAAKKPAPKSAASAKATPSDRKAESRAASAASKDLVPIVRTPKPASHDKPATQGKTVKTASKAEVSHGDHEPKMVRRLPPVDDSLPIAASAEAAASDQQIPIYPSTATR